MTYLKEIRCKNCNKEIIIRSSLRELCDKCRKKHRNEMKKEQLKNPRYKESHSKSVHNWQVKNYQRLLKVSSEWKKRNRNKMREYEINYFKNNPKIAVARNVARKIKISPICVVCEKETKTERHHPDYNKPELVIPLCRQCHADYHKSFGGKINDR